jgi:hypothetical protein
MATSLDKASIHIFKNDKIEDLGIDMSRKGKEGERERGGIITGRKGGSTASRGCRSWSQSPSVHNIQTLSPQHSSGQVHICML